MQKVLISKPLEINDMNEQGSGRVLDRAGRNMSMFCDFDGTITVVM